MASDREALTKPGRGRGRMCPGRLPWGGAWWGLPVFGAPSPYAQRGFYGVPSRCSANAVAEGTNSNLTPTLFAIIGRAQGGLEA